MKTELAILWGIVCLLCIVIEMTTGSFFLLCVSVGALGALVVALLGGSFDVQVLTLAVLSALMIVFVRPLIVRLLKKSHQTRQSNVDALMGREGVVSQTIEPGRFGRVAIDGDDWKACAVSRLDTLEAGTAVRVVGRESLIITVERVDTAAEDRPKNAENETV